MTTGFFPSAREGFCVAARCLFIAGFTVIFGELELAIAVMAASASALSV